METDKLIGALLCCADRKCGVCPYRGCGIACKYRLMNDAATQLAEKDKQIADLETQHRVECCESAGYDCEVRGQLELYKARFEVEEKAHEISVNDYLNVCRQLAAAVEDIPHICRTCGWFDNGDCRVLRYKDYPKDCEHWQWRGVQEAEEGGE